jgi:hypothetical protein
MDVNWKSPGPIEDTGRSREGQNKDSVKEGNKSMMNITNLTTTTQETELNKVIERIRAYNNPPLARNEPLHLEVDGLSENA